MANRRAVLLESPCFMGSPYFLYAGSVHVDEPIEEYLSVTLAEQCHDGSSEQYVGESTLQQSIVY